MDEKTKKELCRLVVLNSEVGKKQQEISKVLGISQMKVSRILSIYKQNPKSLGYLPRKTNSRAGSCYKLIEAQVDDIKQCVLGDATEYGFLGNFWTALRVKELIFQKYSVIYSKSHTHSLLLKWGFSWQTPMTEDYRKDEEAGKIWKNETLPELKKKQPKKRGTYCT